MGIEKPTAGQIFYKGQDITGLDIDERAKLGIGFAFQQPVRFKGLTVRDLLSIAVNKAVDTHELCVYLSEVACAPPITSTERSMQASPAVSLKG